MNTMKKIGAGLLALPMIAASQFALAVPVNYDDLTDAVDFSTTQSAVLVVFAALAGLFIAYKGGKFILRALR